jgi:hypothetical protein
LDHLKLPHAELSINLQKYLSGLIQVDIPILLSFREPPPRPLHDSYMSFLYSLTLLRCRY